ncbi:MAG: hypothetical protein AAF290_06495 [Pseudomonadota bacterium]
MLNSAEGRRLIGIGGWLALALCTLYWLWDARGSLHPLVWVVLLAPFLALLPGMRAARRNSWLLALLAAVGYATVGMMDAIANPGSITAAALLAGVAIVTFFVLIPAIRTMPAPPKPPPEP